jgi:murein DD-endopeptidase MepM/ murein hydrolase activator NlpD
MTRRLLVCACLATLVLAAPAAGEDIVGKKQSIDTRIAELHGTIERTREREHALKGEIVDVTQRIRVLEGQVGDVSQKLHTLEADLALHRARLAKLTELFQLQSQRLAFLRKQHAMAIERRNRRLVAIYESDDPDAVEVLLSAGSFDQLLDQIDYMKQIGTLDKRIAAAVGEAKQEVIVAREHTKRTKGGVESETRSIAVRTNQVRAVRDRLVSARGDLSDARRHKVVSLATLSKEEREEVSEAVALSAQSASLAARIRAAQAPKPGAAPTTPARTGNGTFIWPVQGPVTSPFGWRWGRMHEGIDIGVGYGTPIAAAASGTVVYAGWESGYGNFVLIDHGNGLATAYGHQSSIAVSTGAAVTQGQVIGYVGCTGHCFGPHLHFEVRINGSPVDPLGYL